MVDSNPSLRHHRQPSALLRVKRSNAAASWPRGTAAAKDSGLRRPSRRDTYQWARRYRHGSSVEATKRCRLITAIKTPYLKDGRFDLTAYDKLVEMQISCGVEVRARA